MVDLKKYDMKKGSRDAPKMTTVEQAVCTKEMQNMPDALEKSIKEMIDYAVLRHAREMQFPDKLENVLLSRMYTNGVKDTKNYHWNIFISQIHNPAETHLHHLHSNHHLTINNTLNTKSPEGFTIMH